MLIPIYRKTDDGFEQQFINENETVPSGWTTELEEVSTEEEQTDIKVLKKENEELKAQLEKTKEDVTNTQVALTEVFELIETLV